MKKIIFFLITILAITGCSKTSSFVYEIKSSSPTVKSTSPRFSFDKSHLIDGDTKTSWQIRTAKGGVGEWLELKLREPMDISEIVISNGFQLMDPEYGDLYFLNSRLRKVYICGDDIKCADFNLIDTKDKVRLKVNFSKVMNIKIYIKDVYSGSRWPQDLAVGEIRLVKKISMAEILIVVLAIAGIMGFLIIFIKSSVRNVFFEKLNSLVSSKHKDVASKVEIMEYDSTTTFNQEAYDKGKAFEEHIARMFGSQKDDCTIVHWTNDIHTKKKDIYVESDQNPDFIIRHNPTGKEFAVECKFRSHLWKRKGTNQKVLKWASHEQILHYDTFSKQRNMPVFIVIGLGGKPDQPMFKFCIPLEKARYVDLFISLFYRYPLGDKFIWGNGMLS
jgi:uncharacterized protein YxeA